MCSQGTQPIWLEMVLFSDINAPSTNAPSSSNEVNEMNLNIKQLQHQLLYVYDRRNRNAISAKLNRVKRKLQFRTLFEENTTLKRKLELAEQGQSSSQYELEGLKNTLAVHRAISEMVNDLESVLELKRIIKQLNEEKSGLLSRLQAAEKREEVAKIQVSYLKDTIANHNILSNLLSQLGVGNAMVASVSFNLQQNIEPAAKKRRCPALSDEKNN